MIKSIRRERLPQVDLIVRNTFTSKQISAADDVALQEAVRRQEFTGAAGEIVEAFPVSGPRLLLLGFGDERNQSAKNLAVAADALAAYLSKVSLKAIQLDIRGLESSKAFGWALGAALSSVQWDGKLYPGSKTEEVPRTDLSISAEDEDMDKALEEALAIGKGTNIARTLAATPPNVATPAYLAAEARRIADESGMNCSVYDGDQLIDLKMTGLMTVGGGSKHPPALIVLKYTPEDDSGEEPIALVGKSITFDTGGYTIKSRTGMPGMKFDKSGGCTVLGAMHAIATHVKPKRKVYGVLVAAENLIGPDAYRPDDVITFRNGVTVEVTNTDAEGRLVLADGLCYAEEELKAKYIVDVATLTGGIVTALGSVRAGLFCKDEEMRVQLVESGERTYEKVWPMPLDDDYLELMKSPVADCVNSNLNGTAHPVQGAIFLSQFVTDNVKWAHIDIAGVGGSKEPKNLNPVGPTGFGVRLLTDWIRSL